MKPLALDIKETNNTSHLLNILAFGLMVMGIVLFLIINRSLSYWGLLVSLPIISGLLVFLFNFLFFTSKKSGEIVLNEEEIIFIHYGKKKSIRFSGISKIRLTLFSKTYSFHRNWWPLKEESSPYEPSELNFIHIKPKKGKSRLIRFYLDSRKTENELLNYLHEKCRQYQVGLKVK